MRRAAPRNGAELRIELNRPRPMNAVERAVRRSTCWRAVEEAAADDDGPRGRRSPARAAAFSSGADLKAGFEPDAGGPPGRRTRAARALPPDHRRHPADAQAGARGGQRPRGRASAARSRWPATSSSPRESAYFLLAFVNIGLVPDGGSSLLVPARVGFARAAEMAMLGERVPAPQALEWGLINRVVADDAFDARGRRAGRAPRHRARPRSYAGTKRQLNAWLYARMEEQLELEAHDPAGDGRLGRLRWRACRPSSRSARRAFEGSMSSAAALTASPAPYTAAPVPDVRLAASLLRRCPAVAAALLPRPSPRRPVLPRVGRLAERRRHQDALHPDLRASRWSSSSASRALLIWLAVQVPGPHAAASRPRSTATRGWRSAGPSAPP